MAWQETNTLFTHLVIYWEKFQLILRIDTQDVLPGYRNTVLQQESLQISITWAHSWRELECKYQVLTKWLLQQTQASRVIFCKVLQTVDTMATYGTRLQQQIQHYKLQVNIRKIIYLNYGERYYMIDHRSCADNLSSCKIKV